mmetsp:Transcript_108392/g.171006  ORF Transcript_108392/g.171006 Transcript_108392/m.171006 type:complete len:300 (+) Transcript_108392:108-1007(+)|eukprot:CAMPEP_0169122828 /NCGR_PEP_ID=MMETSP1015-20121227/33445_1 /TAXON_ID=342587 /ORGANISM="Karlodinium micrum, Strain CCMP2283" /LENGTH=299 /DNA_ID=CAMNT_0009186095 /DNA_START=108 /DNA_END=1007 /DNA_ORIENTATION=-
MITFTSIILWISTFHAGNVRGTQEVACSDGVCADGDEAVMLQMWADTVTRSEDELASPPSSPITSDAYTQIQRHSPVESPLENLPHELELELEAVRGSLAQEDQVGSESMSARDEQMSRASPQPITKQRESPHLPIVAQGTSVKQQHQQHVQVIPGDHPHQQSLSDYELSMQNVDLKHALDMQRFQNVADAMAREQLKDSLRTMSQELDREHAEILKAKAREKEKVEWARQVSAEAAQEIKLARGAEQQAAAAVSDLRRAMVKVKEDILETADGTNESFGFTDVDDPSAAGQTTSLDDA